MQHAIPYKISRKAIPSINKVILNNENHYLGIQKDFKRHAMLSKFIPEEKCKLGIAWVHLGLDELLEPHVHPVDSLILVTSGQVKLIGDVEEILTEGDVLAIPAGQVHGFIGIGENGFWGLSIQFEERGLYENSAVPLVQFVKPSKLKRQKEINNLSKLLIRNEQYINKFTENALFKTLKEYRDNAEKLNLFIKYFKTWSNSFQKMVLLQYVNSHDPEIIKIADHHLQEEFGHNKQLGEGDSNSFDPLLDSLTNWFCWNMNILDQKERIVLIHLVIETSATIFYQQLAPIFRDHACNKHFNFHAEHDPDHATMGLHVLENLKPDEYTKLSKIQDHGWRVLGEMFNRIAQLVG